MVSKRMRETILFLAGAVALAVFGIGGAYYVWATDDVYIGERSFVNLYPIYQADCPFGHFYTGTSGSFFIASGCFDTSYKEAYIVKYFVGSELHTKILDSQKTAVVFDGTFSLEEIHTMKEFQNKENKRLSYLDHYIPDYRYIIHLPNRP